MGAGVCGPLRYGGFDIGLECCHRGEDGAGRRFAARGSWAGARWRGGMVSGSTGPPVGLLAKKRL